MKILIISDSHGHIANLRSILEIAKKSGIRAVVHCGDWDDIASVKAVLDSGIPLYAVLGNADIEPEIEELLKYNAKKFSSDFLKIEIDGTKIGVIHKAKKDDKRFESLNLVFSGHYHSTDEKVVDFVKFVRPGAIINGINFAVCETVTGTVDFVKDEN